MLPPRDVARLLRRLQREAPEAVVPGVLYEVPRPRSLPQRLRILFRNLREPGYPGYVASRVGAALRRQADRSAEWLVRMAHACPPDPNGPQDLSLDGLRELLEKQGGRLFLTDDMHRPDALAFVRDLNADLGLVYGTRILKPELFDLPTQGSINIHKRKTPDYRGGGPVGLWEMLDRQTEIGITVHKVAAAVDAGDVIRYQSLPIEPYDTLESLALKADVVGNDLLVDAVADYARGTVRPVKQTGPGKVFKSPKPHVLREYEARLSVDRQRYRPVRGRPFLKLLARFVLYGPRIVVKNWIRRSRGQFPVVILYHHLISDRAHRMGSSTEWFYRQMQFLMRTYRVASLADAVAMLRSGKVTAPTVVITLDDGYRENFVNLRAVTEALGMDAAMFICPGHMDSGEPFGHDVRDNVEGFPPLTWDQVRRMQACGLEFQSHTITHFDCASTDESLLRVEIASAREALEQQLGRPVESFSFPWGLGKNMSPPAVALARASYRNVFSACDGINLPSTSDRWHFYRSPYPNDMIELELQIQQLLELDPEGPTLPF